MTSEVGLSQPAALLGSNQAKREKSLSYTSYRLQLAINISRASGFKKDYLEHLFLISRVQFCNPVCEYCQTRNPTARVPALLKFLHLCIRHFTMELFAIAKN